MKIVTFSSTGFVMVALFAAMLFTGSSSVTPQGANPTTPLDGGLTSIMVEFSGPLRENNTYDGCHGRWMTVDVPANVLTGGLQSGGQVPGPSQGVGANQGQVPGVSGHVEDSRGKLFQQKICKISSFLLSSLLFQVLHARHLLVLQLVLAQLHALPKPMKAP